jgi:hypothetical protein
MIDAIVIVCVIQLPVAQKARLGAAAAKIAMPIIHITEACCAAIMRAWAHIRIMPFAMTQDAIAPFGALVVYVVSTIFLTLATVKPLLTLPSPAIECILVMPLLSYASDGGVVNEGGTDSTMITPCRSSSVAVGGTVVVMTLVTSLNGMINMATIVCGGMCAGGGGRDSAHGG